MTHSSKLVFTDPAGEIHRTDQMSQASCYTDADFFHNGRALLGFKRLPVLDAYQQITGCATLENLCA